MSLKPFSAYVVPERTASVARAAFSAPAVETLRRVWVQQFMIVDGVAHLRPAEFFAPSSARIQSPYDTQARFASKRSTKWLGSKAGRAA
jgi:hypothetical protein